jgi:hypothetical protein
MGSLLAVIGVALASPALASSDGRVELSHDAALAGGVTPGDTAGYPVTISVAGSYVLTSDLTVPANTSGIQVTAPDVSIDLNGFALRASFLCTPGSCAVGANDPAGVRAAGQGLILTDGVVSGFAGECIVALGPARVQRVYVHDCALNGINVAANSLVLDSQVERVGFGGIRFLLSSRGIVRGNDVSKVATQVASGEGIATGAVATGGNRCDDGSCSRRALRRFYLTVVTSLGAGASFICSPGFHMASAFELLDPSRLEYAGALGEPADDAGSGPVANFEGRVRTGLPASTTANCLAWTSFNAAHMGAQLILAPPASWNAAGTQHAPWRVETARPCSGDARVWCIED